LLITFLYKLKRDRFRLHALIQSASIYKQPMVCDAQLAATCLFAPNFFGGRCWPVK